MAPTRWNGPKFSRHVDEHIKRLEKHPSFKSREDEIQALRLVKTNDPKTAKAIQNRLKSLEQGSGALPGILNRLKAIRNDMKGIPDYQAKRRTSKSPTKRTRPHKKGGQ